MLSIIFLISNLTTEEETPHCEDSNANDSNISFYNGCPGPESELAQTGSEIALTGSELALIWVRAGPEQSHRVRASPDHGQS